jgi:hypothetical protein
MQIRTTDYASQDTAKLLETRRDLSSALPMAAPGSQARDLIRSHLATVVTELGRRTGVSQMPEVPFRWLG